MPITPALPLLATWPLPTPRKASATGERLWDWLAGQTGRQDVAVLPVMPRVQRGLRRLACPWHTLPDLDALRAWLQTMTATIADTERLREAGRQLREAWVSSLIEGTQSVAPSGRPVQVPADTRALTSLAERLTNTATQQQARRQNRLRGIAEQVLAALFPDGQPLHGVIRRDQVAGAFPAWAMAALIQLSAAAPSNALLVVAMP